MDQRETSIVVQVAFKGAIELLKSAVFQVDNNTDYAADVVADLTTKFTDLMVSQVATNTLQEAFPGSQVQQSGGPQFAAQQVQPNVAPLQAVPQPQAAGPAPLPGGGGFDKWGDFRANPQNWEDRRSNKRSNQSPDFVHRFMPNPKKPNYKMSLYLHDDDTPFDIKQAYGVA